jgi:XTP/dITP diphosphohydrolase
MSGVKLLFGTTNPGKLRELRRLVAALPLQIVGPGDLAAPLPEVVEDGATFAANAEKKATAWARWSGLHTLADDSGLCVDALGGAPGVHSARWSDEDPQGEPSSPVCALGEAGLAELGREQSPRRSRDPLRGPTGGPVAGRAVRDERNNDKLLRLLQGVPDERRGAEYQAVLCLARPDGSVVASVTGRCRGRIGYARRGAGGFGYDPLFLVGGAPGAAERTMAELGAEEKDAISHRGAAFRQLVPILSTLALGA